MTSSNPKYRPKTPCSDTITLGVRASIYEFEGDLNIQSTTRDPQAFQPPVHSLGFKAGRVELFQLALISFPGQLPVFDPSKMAFHVFS